MDIFLMRTVGGLVAGDEEAKTALRRWRIGETLRCAVKKPRCYDNHKRYFALVKLTFDNQEKYASFEHFRKAVQLEAGHVDWIPSIKGQLVPVPRSIDYSTLDELEFNKVFMETMAVCSKVLGDIGLHELEAEVAGYSQ